MSNKKSTKKKARNMWQLLIEAPDYITLPSERRQASLVSIMLLILAISMTSGVIYMGFFSTSLNLGIVMAFAQIGEFIAYGFSRTRYYKVAPLISIFVLALIPVFNVFFGTDHSTEALMILLIWNVLTILLSSALADIKTTILFSLGNIYTLLLFPILITDITYAKLTIPIVFNTVIPILILVFTRHRNLMEKDRQVEMTQLNEQLQMELKERLRAEKQLSYTATHDGLTGLPNRVMLIDRLQFSIDHAARHKDYKYAVLFLDLDRFKVANDSLGHNAGDQLLKETAARLYTCIRGEDMVARLGGDEFVILLDDIDGIADAIRVSERVQESLTKPFEIDEYQVYIFVSIGITLGSEEYTKPDAILRDADIAMYRAKGKGLGRYEIFNSEMLTTVMSRMEIETSLRNALSREEFFLEYQPIIDLNKNLITGFEALVRWKHPTKGIIPPAGFIPIIEETGLIIPIGYWILNEACRQISVWQKSYPSDPPLNISVNWSLQQCSDKDMVQKISNILQENKLDPHSLILEITESFIIGDVECISTTLSDLSKLGIQVQIDDFGTAYSNLGYLHELNITTIKIDRTFINRLGDVANSLGIVPTIMGMAHDLGMKVIAEGVETNEQLNILKEMDCEYGQGFFFTQPIDNKKVNKLLKKYFSGD